MNNHNYIKHAKCGKWDVYLSPSTNHGYYEHDILGEGGSIELHGRMVIDYDGMYELPKGVVSALRELGCTFDEYVLPD